MNNHNHQLKVANINDVTGFGRCSVAVAMPLISHLGVQCCAVPTAILSNQTGFESFYCMDFTDYMDAYVEEWKKIGLAFDGILTGFLSSVKQVGLVERMIPELSRKGTCVVVDPVMGDYGKLYKTYTSELASGMKRLIPLADIVTPNLTEACYLTETSYKECFREGEIKEMATKLCDMGPGKVVITGIDCGERIMSYCYERGGEGNAILTPKVEVPRSGTGDVFSAIVTAGAVRGVALVHTVQVASSFVRRCMMEADKLNMPPTDGLPFELVMDELRF